MESAGPDSEVDLLVTFEPDANWGLLEQTTTESELSAMLNRKVDLVGRRAIERKRQLDAATGHPRICGDGSCGAMTETGESKPVLETPFAALDASREGHRLLIWTGELATVDVGPFPGWRDVPTW